MQHPLGLGFPPVNPVLYNATMSGSQKERKEIQEKRQNRETKRRFRKRKHGQFFEGGGVNLALPTLSVIDSSDKISHKMKK